MIVEIFRKMYRRKKRSNEETLSLISIIELTRQIYR